MPCSWRRSARQVSTSSIRAITRWGRWVRSRAGRGAGRRSGRGCRALGSPWRSRPPRPSSRGEHPGPVDPGTAPTGGGCARPAAGPGRRGRRPSTPAEEERGGFRAATVHVGGLVRTQAWLVHAHDPPQGVLEVAVAPVGAALAVVVGQREQGVSTPGGDLGDSAGDIGGHALEGSLEGHVLGHLEVDGPEIGIDRAIEDHRPDRSRELASVGGTDARAVAVTEVVQLLVAEYGA